MTRCFNCKKFMVNGTADSVLARAKLPVFCSEDCSKQFPDNGTKEFDDRIKEFLQK